MYSIENRSNWKTNNKNYNKMKTLKIENLADFVLTNEEMINVRGGNGRQGIAEGNPTRPPIIIEI